MILIYYQEKLNHLFHVNMGLISVNRGCHNPYMWILEEKRTSNAEVGLRGGYSSLNKLILAYIVSFILELYRTDSQSRDTLRGTEIVLSAAATVRRAARSTLPYLI